MYESNRDDESSMTLSAEGHGSLGLRGPRREEEPAVDVPVECEECGTLMGLQETLECLACGIATCDACLVDGLCPSCDVRRSDVGEFLKEFKRIVESGRGLDVIPRRKNIEALAELEITRKMREKEILALSVSNYSKGPKPDRDKPGYVWEFGKEIGGREVYIKLKIDQVDGGKIAKCLSFHLAADPVSYPFRPYRRRC